MTDAGIFAAARELGGYILAAGLVLALFGAIGRSGK